LDEPTVKFVVDGLSRRHFVVEKSGFGSRVPKYQQIFCNTEFGSLKFTPQETGVLCELLLRGPQTPGELRARVPRLAELPDPSVIETVLAALAARPDGALVTRLAREPGRRDSRWAQLFEELPESVTVATGDDPDAPAAVAAPQGPTKTELLARVASLEAEVAALRAELGMFKQAGATQDRGA
jgi:uncharacterized protein YceH (UPF0502 family)